MHSPPPFVYRLAAVMFCRFAYYQYRVHQKRSVWRYRNNRLIAIERFIYTTAYHESYSGHSGGFTGVFSTATWNATATATANCNRVHMFSRHTRYNSRSIINLYATRGKVYPPRLFNCGNQVSRRSDVTRLCLKIEIFQSHGVTVRLKTDRTYKMDLQ